MPNHYCCVLTCKMTKRNAGADVRFIKFPVDPKLLEKWRAVIGRGPDFPISQSTRICSKHFVSGRRSLNPVSEDYIPSIFPPSEYRKRTLCRSCRKMNCICDSNASKDIFNPNHLLAGLSNPLGTNLYSETSTDDSTQLIGEDDEIDNDSAGLNETDGTPLKMRRVGLTKMVQPTSTSSSHKGLTTPGVKSDNLFVATKLMKRELEIDLLAKIKEVELDHSRKMEVMSRHHTMTIANLKEEFQQKVHTMKCEWEEEKQKLWAEIGYMKDVLTRRPYF